MKSSQSRQNPVHPRSARQTFRGITLRTRMLIVFALLGILPPMIIGSIATWISSQGLREHAFAEVNSVAVLKSNAINEWLQVLQTNLPLAFENKVVKEGVTAILRNDQQHIMTQNQLRRQLTAFKDKTGYFVEIFVLDRDGRVVLSTDSEQEGKIHKTQSFFQNGLTDSYFSSPIYEVSLNNYSITLSGPIKSANGTVMGVLTGRANISKLSEIMQQETGLGETGESYLVGSNFAALTTLKNTEFELGKTYVRTAGVTDALNFRTDGSAEYVDYAGNNTLGVYKWVPELQVALIAEHQEADALAASARVLQVSMTVIFIGVSLSLVVAVLFTRTITGPINNLVTVANNIIGQGNFEVRADVVRNDEIGVLAQAFNSMIEQLREFIEALEHRVQERTQALSSVAEISTAASTILETDALLQQVVDLAKKHFNFYHAHIYLLDDSGNTLVLSSGAGEVGRQMVAAGRSIPLDQEQSLVARAAREKKGVTANDVTLAPDFLPNPLLPDTHSEMAVPMMIGDEVIGVFDVQSEVIGRFTEADIAVQTTLGSQVASALQNARSFTKIKEAEQLTRVIVEAASDAIFIKDRQHRYLMVNEGYARPFHKPASEFIGLDDLQLGFPEEVVLGNPQKGMRGFWADDNLVFETGKTQHYPNDPIVVDGVVHTLDTLKIPLRNAEGEVWGVLGFSRDVTERYHLEEVTRRRAVEQEAINTITQKIQNTTTIESALQIAARELGHLFGKKPVAISLEVDAPAVAEAKSQH